VSEPRVLCWFSCGAASAAAAKLALAKHQDRLPVEVLYCDTLAHEHPDNRRFLGEVERWLGVPIKILRSTTYRDIYDVFDRTGWLVGPAGARCTVELKKVPRLEHQRPDDVHVFGLTFDERERIDQFSRQNLDLRLDWVLRERRITKRYCYTMLKEARIELPAMYRLGYRNNNCVGCVKGGAGYWNSIRRDFPDVFDRMAAQERKMNVAINKLTLGGERVPVFLDELPANAGRGENEPDVECGPQCVLPLGLAEPKTTEAA
jgi:hypothetical protein